MKTENFIAPKLLGPFIDPRSGVDQGVHCYGIALDDTNVLVACILGARVMRLETFLVEFGYGATYAVEIKGEAHSFSVSLSDDYQRYPYEHPDGLGGMTLVLHKAALMGLPLTVLGDDPHFYVWGPFDGKTPHLDLWARRMQDVLSLPLDSEWYDLLWNKLVEQEWAVPCNSLGGFAPLWDVSISSDEWHRLVMDLVADGTLS